jgi:hypothetical protein
LQPAGIDEGLEEEVPRDAMRVVCAIFDLAQAADERIALVRQVRTDL